MKKSYLLGVALSSLLAAPAMAGEDFHALSGVSNLTPMAEEQLSTIEGGNPCANFNLLGIQVGTSQTCANVASVSQSNLAGLALLQTNVAFIEQNIGD